ncbi:MAG: TonB-dependent receptor [Prevotellaceae bacterium]|jgi:iron complex outermembrane receptor protein|nr:TonB-dependent receptor [Prevotellaceae bacterium]
MHTGYIPAVFILLWAVLPVHAQEADSMKVIQLEGVTVSASYEKRIVREAALPTDVANARFLREHFTGNLIQALEHLPGIHAMDIGSGFSKPAIRGMGFNRIIVAENGIKQEGQQWGADHGLEMDAFNTERVVVRKGPASLLYGSDAMGGAIEIVPLPPPADDQVSGEAVLLGKSVNGTLGASVMAGVKKGNRYTRFRYTEQHFGDYRIPADTIVYLTQRLPVYGRRLKNTAGLERDVSFHTESRKGRYSSRYAASNAYQKTGFFPGAHGIPDASRLTGDGDSRNTELPYSAVNHLKASMHHRYMRDRLAGYWDAGFQSNYREERSLFHTHYGNQPVPVKDPDKELVFLLNTYSSTAKIKLTGLPGWEHTAGWDVQYQQNRIAGYSFLLPEYDRFTTGLYWLASWRAEEKFSVSGGVRYDCGYINIRGYTDAYLEAWLDERGYGDEAMERYKWRSYPVKRQSGDFSGSLGIVWHPGDAHLVKVNAGRSFRLPGANELASNGVHHGTFRHEQGDPSLSSEQGWQLDASYAFEGGRVVFSVSPFVSWFENYIYLKPTGEWSVLPHAGQIYRYTETEAVFAGGEITCGIDLFHGLNYTFIGEYVYTANPAERIPLSFSPPASMRNTLAWEGKGMRAYVELQRIAAQHRVARNEDPTPGASLLHAGASVHIPSGRTRVECTLSIHNVFNTKYYNHLSFYRKVEIPEPGRNFQVLIKIPFKSKIK